MADRRVQGNAPGRFSGGGDQPLATRESPEDWLRIDREDLDGGLIEQPDRYYKVALAHTEATALRDAAKLDLEHLQANLDVKIRADAIDAGEKTTEASIQQEMRLDERYQAAKHRLLELSAAVDRCAALKEAFQQRSFMLRELVQLAVHNMGDTSGAAGAYEARARVAEEAKSLRPQRSVRDRLRTREE